ncbi:endonuclease/exonuclease/phosphatase family protein [Ornithinimicrobium pekingense]|uniref:Metal-dependent hydrolase n=1 Tax=Ornithinimicrobium pekingense TaxID=384677 RepID=A0ABQ2F7P2_9MICO|nr:endonuclease/exonuclease/phosphatase family protein [Ornithinimicrobium pekingense]GGK69388.1 metal-dependent hydrolase [Ornithinimicrobium pekingense]
MPHTPDPSSLRVATYNLRGLKDDAHAAAAVVRAIAPDVLLLQEVPRYPGSDYAISAFARQAGMLWSGRTRLVSGTSLMTSLRVLASDSQDRRLRVGLRENPRSYTVARVSAPGRPTVTVVSVHLPLKGEQRVDHVGTVLRELSEDLGLPTGAPLVIGGDLNEDSAGPAWGLVAAELAEVSDDRPSFPAASPQRRIDAVFARGHQEAVPGDPALLEGMELAAASDHVPVWVDLVF